jgi:hypothetical protein
MSQREKSCVFGARSSGGRDFAEGNEVGFDRNALGDLHVKKGLKGLEFAGVGYGEAQEKLLNGFFAAGVFDGALGAKGGGAGDDHDGTRGIESRDEGQQGVIFGEERIGGGGEIGFLFAGLRVNVKNREVALAGTDGHALEDELSCTRNFQKVQIFRRRADENQVGILGVIQGEEAAALDAEIAAELAENLIEAMDSNYFADAGVVIPDNVFRVVGRVVITHSGFGAAYERGVAEHEPGFFGAGEKRLPEGLEGGGSGFGIASKGSRSGLASEIEGEERARQEKREDHYREEPTTRGLLVDGMRVFRREMRVSIRLRSAIPFVERECVGAFGKFYTDGVGGAFAGVVLG